VHALVRKVLGRSKLGSAPIERIPLFEDTLNRQPSAGSARSMVEIVDSDVVDGIHHKITEIESSGPNQCSRD
jgi:hypothetical protein